MRGSVLALCLACAPGLALADQWQNVTPEATDRAFWEVDAGGRTLQFGCFSGQSVLGFTLDGGSETLPVSTQEAAGVMFWIELPDGRTGRYSSDPIDYLGGPENAVIGRVEIQGQGAEFFAAGQTIFVTDPSGAEIFRSGMGGTAAARRDFAATCGW